MNIEIIKGEGGKVSATCAFCQGKGSDPFGLLSRISVCQVCGGRKEVVVPAPAVRCAFCRGTGVHRDQRLTCDVCGGKGLVGVKEPIETCPNCKGKAIVAGDYLPCLKCGGKGVITKR